MRSRIFKQNAVSFMVGAIFAVGLALGGMTQPQKIIAFLDPWAWDPSLLFVMLGAVGTHALAYPIVRREKSPLFDSQWHVPTRKDITLRLTLGAMLFGMGWGLGGFCPGPGIVSLVTGRLEPFVFVVTMLAGMMLFKFTEPFLKLRD